MLLTKHGAFAARSRYPGVAAGEGYFPPREASSGAADALSTPAGVAAGMRPPSGGGEGEAPRPAVPAAGLRAGRRRRQEGGGAAGRRFRARRRAPLVPRAGTPPPPPPPPPWPLRRTRCPQVRTPPRGAERAGGVPGGAAAAAAPWSPPAGPGRALGGVRPAAPCRPANPRRGRVSGCLCDPRPWLVGAR